MLHIRICGNGSWQYGIFASVVWRLAVFARCSFAYFRFAVGRFALCKGAI